MRGANVVPNYPVPRHTKTTLLHPSPSGIGGDGSSWGGSVGVWEGLLISGYWKDPYTAHHPKLAEPAAPMMALGSRRKPSSVPFLP